MRYLIYAVVVACGLALMVIGATGVLADERAEWSLAEMNRTIDQTNFIVGAGCSGTLISVEHRIVQTAFHCVDKNIRVVEREEADEDGVMRKVRREQRDRITIAQKDYRGFEQVGSITYQTNIIAHRRDRDLALLQLVADNLRSTVHTRVLPEDKTVIRGDRVIAVGNPRGLDATLTSGVIGSTSRMIRFPWTGPDEIPVLQFDAASAPGSSGGAIYDSEGYLIGTVVAGIPGEVGLAIPVNDIRDILAANCFADVYGGENPKKCNPEDETVAAEVEVEDEPEGDEETEEVAE